MKRLTQKHYGASDYYMTCSAECERDHCVECAELEKIVNLLGAYEDTGLMPEEVEALKLSMMGKTVAEIKEFEGLLNLKTNADCIRAMSDEELAEFLDTTQKMECEAFHVINSDGTLKFESLKNGWLEWLQQPAPEVKSK